jgi:hypothetical protein
MTDASPGSTRYQDRVIISDEVVATWGLNFEYLPPTQQIKVLYGGACFLKSFFFCSFYVGMGYGMLIVYDFAVILSTLPPTLSPHAWIGHWPQCRKCGHRP